MIEDEKEFRATVARTLLHILVTAHFETREQARHIAVDLKELCKQLPQPWCDVLNERLLRIKEGAD